MGRAPDAETAADTAVSCGVAATARAVAPAIGTTRAALNPPNAGLVSHRVASLTCLADAAAGPSLAGGSSEVTSSGGPNSIPDAGRAAPSSSLGGASSESWRPTVHQCEASPCASVLLAAAPGCTGQRILSQHDPRCLPINTGGAIEFETPLFSGRACVWVQGLPGAPDSLFAGRRRRSLVTVQGRFRQAVPLDDLVTGQEFSAVRNLPPAWLVNGLLLKVARACSPSMEIGPLSAPAMLMPVIAGCNEIHAARPGEEPDPAGPPCEDLRLFDPVCLTAPDGSPLSAVKRRARFVRAAARAGRCWPTDLVFTFYFYQQFVNLSQYELDVMHLRFDLTRFIQEPLQLMMRCRRSGQFAYCLHVWHSRLLRER